MYLTTSTGDSLTDINGIDHIQAIDFLFNLRHKRKRKSGIVFVCYAFQRDNEFIFSTLSREVKDKLFLAYRVKKEIDKLEFELEAIDDDYFKFDLDTQDFEFADFEKHVNMLAIQELKEVIIDDYKIELVNGKFLNITKAKKSITIYDIYGFFKPHTLRESVRDFLNEQQPLLDRSTFDAIDFFDGETDLDRLKSHAAFEVNYIQRLITKVNDSLVQNNIKLSRFYGASAISSKILSGAGARKQYHNYRHKRQLSNHLFEALRTSVHGGRSEQFKIGTLKNVNVYDINSAYAYAATRLPCMLHKPLYTEDHKAHKDNDFSFWFCDYDFTSLNPYFGYLPNRELTRYIKYKLKGSGVFWQPEIKYVQDNFPECIKVGYGYSLTSDKAEFTQAIDELYNLRLQLQRDKLPLEKILKLALSSIYGKFAQHNGKSYYFNHFYAGYITSVTRAQLLEATKGYETSTIAFYTDAIHSVCNHLPVSLSNELGAYKLDTFDSITYLDNGVYQCTRDGQVVKTKTRGFRKLNFNQCLEELKLKRSYTALSEFFVGHNLFSQHLFTGAGYLSDAGLNKTMRPAEKDMTSMRVYEVNKSIDLTTQYLDSKPIASYSGMKSAPYVYGNDRGSDAALDTILAGRI